MASGLKYFALTTDCWISGTQHSFMSLTVHYISAEWNLQSHMLETGEITTEHTAVNLSSYLQESLGCWNLHPTQVSAAVTDNTSNITAAISRMEWLHFSYTLQLGVQKAEKYLEPLVEQKKLSDLFIPQSNLLTSSGKSSRTYGMTNIQVL